MRRSLFSFAIAVVMTTVLLVLAEGKRPRRGATTANPRSPI